jgi:hypothetical protein
LDKMGFFRIHLKNFINPRQGSDNSEFRRELDKV